MAGHAPLRRGLARLAGRMLSLRGWERLGYARPGDYARERTGVSGAQLYELARVDRMLAGLPRIEASFVAGEVSWTQVRLLGRAARPETEVHWLSVARRVSAEGLAVEVRGLDQRAAEAGDTALDPEEDEVASDRIAVSCTREARAKWFTAHRLVQRFAGQRLTHGDCAEYVAAEVMSAIGLEGQAETGEGRGRCPRAVPDPVSRPRVRPAPDPEGAGLLRSLLDGLGAADAFEVDVRLRCATGLERRFEARVGPLLRELAEEGLYRDLGFRSLDQYAKERLGMVPSKARALLRLERAMPSSAALRRAWRSGRISWSQALALVPLLAAEASRPWHAAWIARAARVTVRRLEDDVGQAIGSGCLDPARLPRLPSGLQIGEDSAAGGGAAPPVRIFLTAPRDVVLLFRAALRTVKRRIERRAGRPSSDPEAFEAMVEHALDAWQRERPASRRYPVFVRDGWRCVVPGCMGYRNLQEHHVTFRSASGGNELANRITLCAWHHLRGVHGGLVRCTGQAPEGLRFELGIRSGVPSLESYEAGDFTTRR